MLGLLALCARSAETGSLANPHTAEYKDGSRCLMVFPPGKRSTAKPGRKHKTKHMSTEKEIRLVQNQIEIARQLSAFSRTHQWPS